MTNKLPEIGQAYKFKNSNESFEVIEIEGDTIYGFLRSKKDLPEIDFYDLEEFWNIFKGGSND